MGRVKVRDLDSISIYKLLLCTMKGKPFRESNLSYNSVVDKLTKQYGNRKYNAIQWFFTNTAKAIRNGYAGFSFKMNNNYWSGNVCNIGARQVNSVIDTLEQEGYITVFLGNLDQKSKWLSYPSVIRFEPKLLNLLDNSQITLHVAKGCLEENVIVKDRKTKEQLKIEPSEELDKMVKEVTAYNASLGNAQIEFMGDKLPLVEYKRSFSDSLFKGGRLFVHGGGIQLLPESYRLEHITINGSKIVELDYKANHPYMLYTLMYHNVSDIDELISKDFDPYAADSSFIIKDDIAIAKHMLKYELKKYNPVRNLYKRALLMSINCDSFQQTKNTLANELHLDSLRNEKDREFLGLDKPDVKKVIQSLADHNYLIEKEFYSDKGVWLQNLDSEVALRVIDLMIQEGEVVLCYHDSFCCRESVESLLHAAMIRAWRDILGSDKYCKISKK